MQEINKGKIMKKIKHCCILFLAMLPMVAVSFAAQSSLSVDQIRIGTTSNSDLQDDSVRSGFNAKKSS